MKPLKLTPLEQSEDDLHLQVVAYLRLKPWMIWNHCPNGGHRDVRVAARLKAMGVKRGVPDIEIREQWYDASRVPSEGFGIALELKSRRGRTSVDQDAWLNALEERGYLVGVPRTFDEARALIDKAVRG